MAEPLFSPLRVLLYLFPKPLQILEFYCWNNSRF
jgi:hypothetical protein